MQNVLDQIKAWLSTIAELPVIAPILAILHSRSVTFALLGTFVYGILPTNPWLAADPARLKTVGDIIIVVTLMISGRYSIESIVDAYKQVPTGTLEELIRTLVSVVLQELQNPTTPEMDEAAKTIARNATIKETTARFIAGRPGSDG